MRSGRSGGDVSIEGADGETRRVKRSRRPDLRTVEGVSLQVFIYFFNYKYFGRDVPCFFSSYPPPPLKLLGFRPITMGVSICYPFILLAFVNVAISAITLSARD